MSADSTARATRTAPPSSRRKPGSIVLHETLDSGFRRNDEGKDVSADSKTRLTPTTPPSSRRKPGSIVLHETLDSGFRRNDEGKDVSADSTTRATPTAPPSSRRKPGSIVLHETLDSGFRRNDEVRVGTSSFMRQPYPRLRTMNGPSQFATPTGKRRHPSMNSRYLALEGLFCGMLSRRYRQYS